MAYKAFDITLKDMIEDRAAAWPGLLGPWPAQRVDVIDADISTLTASSDKVLRVHDVGAPWLLNPELQADHELGLPEKLHFKSVALHKRHKLLVRSVVFL